MSILAMTAINKKRGGGGRYLEQAKQPEQNSNQYPAWAK